MCIRDRDKIHVISRCEVRQAETLLKFPQVTCHLGDVTNPSTLPYLSDVGSVFNLAASKHVERGESNHEYCVLANYNGVINTYSWAFEHKAKSFTQSSTDKAVEAWNCYGAAKFLAEKYLRSRNRRFPISVFSWANVIGSRGSVLHKFKETLLKNNEILITDFDMTRFWVNLDDVAMFMWANRLKDSGDINHIPPMKSSTVLELGLALAEYLNIPEKKIKIREVGIRPGEKMHETMVATNRKRMDSKDWERYTRKELVQMIREVL